LRVFLDSNILFSAVQSPEGKAASIIRDAGTLRITVLTCQLAVEEAARNLKLKSPAKAGGLSPLLSRLEIVPTAGAGRCPVPLPAKDVPILLSALAGGATHLLTGDFRDFGPYMNKPARTGGIVIQSVDGFLRSL
jgi:predicted nucleic acid-binding protein